jgi:hypothetical protein
MARFIAKARVESVFGISIAQSVDDRTFVV